MDCCNYVQPYHPGHGNFYQQQHFCYDNMTGYATTSTAYGTAPISDSIEVNARYARLQAAYPTDYVYNPKEARLRKAMREQCRELSRQSILQSTVTTTSGNASATGANISVSSLPSSSSGYNSGRIINPWFPVGHTGPASHIKPMLSHRAHQRTFDKTKEVLRKQPECAGAFSAASAAAAVGGLESNDYCSGGGIGEFSDAQKWHPYQSTAAYHARGPINKMTSRHAMQSINTHGHGPWNQFCGVLDTCNFILIKKIKRSQKTNFLKIYNSKIIFINLLELIFSMAAQNQMVRGPRHMVFLQDQQERHCGYPDEMPMNYMTNKIDSHRLQPSYTQNYQVIYLFLLSKYFFYNEQYNIYTNQQETEKCIEDASRWEPPSAEPAITNLVSSPREQERERVREKHPLKKEESNNKEYQENVEPQTKTPRKQPLPGFHQAFGSTEIGRFSRSEFFASMVGDNNVSSSGSVPSSTNSSAIGVGVVGSNSNGVSKNRNSSIDTSSDINSQSSRVDSVDLESLSNPSDDVITSDDVDNTSPDNFNSLSSLSTMTSHFDSVKTTMPRWHSPYISAIGSQI
ncbi:GSCOCG00002035001-RA-CDS [Cotesia congregata]|nr:GSCOCG00002035001-RA-CDS [Cotesia congregata]